MPYTDLKKETVKPQDDSDIYFWDKLVLAEIELRKGYEIELEAGIDACNFKAQNASGPAQ